MRLPGSMHAAALAVAAGLLLGTAPAASADASCPGSGVQPAAANLAQVEAATLCLVNEQRAQHGLGALAPSAVLQAAALQHSQDMVKNNFFSHDSSSGEDFEDRILRFDYAPPNVQWVAGENIAWGTLSLSTPDAIVVSWMNSPEHRANILASDYRELGVGVVPATPSGDPTGATYTADFGARASAPRAAKHPRSHRRSKHRSKRHAKHRRHHRRAKHGGCTGTSSSAISLC